MEKKVAFSNLINYLDDLASTLKEKEVFEDWRYDIEKILPRLREEKNQYYNIEKIALWFSPKSGLLDLPLNTQDKIVKNKLENLYAKIIFCLKILR